MPTTVSISVSGDSPIEVLHSDKEEARVINPGQTWNETLDDGDSEVSLRLAVGDAPAAPEPAEE